MGEDNNIYHDYYQEFKNKKAVTEEVRRLIGSELDKSIDHLAVGIDKEFLNSDNVLDLKTCGKSVSITFESDIFLNHTDFAQKSYEIIEKLRNNNMNLSKATFGFIKTKNVDLEQSFILRVDRTSMHSSPSDLEKLVNREK
ncbi:hypothetical protein SAMN02745123_01001 [Desulforamulus aeronauticus DSM 10349]|uniref:Uncharacterized protein n=2 Tax=Desulforamulus aeronauticus TaxID=53343 RepID=A0A1M6QEQ3_9FIRM|nr:hypothetical protein SAMN02745123_01001 [Desulforamulus aeronauticus DSM 10349]